MKSDEFSFFNQQLAAMVRDGIPLETAMRRLCADMRRGPLRDELQKLEAALAKGTPLREAAAARKLPDLYRQMLEVGAQSNNLPAVLTMLADHYQRRHVIWTRLKGLMVYPAIVFFGAFLLSCFLSVLMNRVVQEIVPELRDRQFRLADLTVALWIGPLLLGLVLLIVVLAAATPRLRQLMRWRLPAFREASLAQVASALAIMLKSGVSMDKALSLMVKLERGSPAGTEFARWHQRLAAGQTSFSEIASGRKFFPALFIWTVSQAHEDVPGGFQHTAETYQARALYRTEALLYAVLPCSVLALGMVIIAQLQPVLAMFGSFFGQIEN